MLQLEVQNLFVFERLKSRRGESLYGTWELQTITSLRIFLGEFVQFSPLKKSRLFALPESAIDKGLISTDPLWITLIGRGTGASPAIVDQWATHR